MVRFFIAAFTLLIASPAFACGVMEKSDPRVGSTVDAADHVTLYFSEAFDPEQSKVVIVNSLNEPQAVLNVPERARNGPNLLRIGLKKPLPAGIYTVTWSVFWLDCGNKTQGDFHFTVKPMDMSH